MGVEPILPRSQIMKTFIRMSTVGLIASALAGSVAGAAEPAQEARDAAAQQRPGQEQFGLGGCNGDSCTGLDPGTTGCEADAFTRASTNILSGGTVIGKIALRYSPSCNAAWARTSTESGASFLRSEVVRDSPYAAAQAASPTAVTALRGPMVGVRAGSLITATGRIGPQYGYYPNFASVSSRF
jgi:hypothetical protein